MNEQADEKQETFDQGACSILREAHALICNRYPEVRCVASTIDYHGALNDADIKRGVWSDGKGPVLAADAVFGSLFQSLRLVEEQMRRAIETAIGLRQEALELAAAVARLRSEDGFQETQEEDREAVLPAVSDRIPADDGRG